MSKEKCLIIAGGQSTEHAVSRMSATSVLKELDESRYEKAAAGITKDGTWYLLADDIADLTREDWLKGADRISDLMAFLKSFDVVFPVLHGLYGEDGTIQGLLELARVPYVGCRVLSSACCMDKIYTKMLLNQAGIRQVPYVYIKKKISGELVAVDEQFDDHEDYLDFVEKKIGYPCFVKPSNSGSSVGCAKAKNRIELQDAVALAARYDAKILVEREVDCLELETAVLGNDDPKVSEVGQILPHGEFYSYESKYEDEQSAVCIPARVDKTIREEIRSIALKAFKVMDCQGLARVDFFLDKKDGGIYLNEINSMPGFTGISMYPKLWMDAGYKYADLITELLTLAKNGRRLYE